MTLKIKKFRKSFDNNSKTSDTSGVRVVGNVILIEIKIPLLKRFVPIKIVLLITVILYTVFTFIVFVSKEWV